MFYSTPEGIFGCLDRVQKRRCLRDVRLWQLGEHAVNLTRRKVVSCLASLPLASAPTVLSSRTKFGDLDPVDFGRRAPVSFPIHGMDAARFQGSMNWRRIKQQNVQFAWIKATEGGDLTDPQFNANWSEAARAGVPIGAYHFYYFCTAPETQAKWFIRNVPRQSGGLPPVLDLEWNPFSPTCTLRPPASEVQKLAKRFIRIVEQHYQTKVVIYTTPDFWHRNQVASLKRDFWLRSTAKHVEKLYDTRDWRFWQYTSTGVLEGINKKVDLNCFNGSQRQWNKWLSERAVR